MIKTKTIKLETMKKQFLLCKPGFIPLMILCCSVNAQTNRLHEYPNTISAKEVAWDDNGKKKEFTVFTGNTGLNTKALKNFSKTFKEATNAQWVETGNGFKAEFIKEDIVTTVFYDRKGRWVGNVRGFQENKLPKDIRHQVKSIYYDYSISYVQEITAGNKTVYLVKIEDKNSMKTIRITEGEMDEYEAFEKSK
jgi:hypothetical protein